MKAPSAPFSHSSTEAQAARDDGMLTYHHALARRRGVAPREADHHLGVADNRRPSEAPPARPPTPRSGPPVQRRRWEPRPVCCGRGSHVLSSGAAPRRAPGRRSRGNRGSTAAPIRWEAHPRIRGPASHRCRPAGQPGAPAGPGSPPVGGAWSASGGASSRESAVPPPTGSDGPSYGTCSSSAAFRLASSGLRS